MQPPFFVADLYLLPVSEGGISKPLPRDSCTVRILVNGLELIADLRYFGTPIAGSKFRPSIYPRSLEAIKEIKPGSRMEIYLDKLIGHAFTFPDKVSDL